LKHLIWWMPGSASLVRESAPRTWTALAGAGQGGQVILVAEPGGEDGLAALALLGYRPESPGGHLATLDPLGRGEDCDAGLFLEPFFRRVHLRGGCVSPSVRTRGVARALGLAIYDWPGDLLASILARLEEHDLLLVETPHVSTRAELEIHDSMSLAQLAPRVTSAGGLRLLVVAGACHGAASSFVLAGAGVTALQAELPLIDRGEELLARCTQGFNI